MPAGDVEAVAGGDGPDEGVEQGCVFGGEAVSGRGDCDGGIEGFHVGGDDCGGG